MAKEKSRATAPATAAGEKDSRSAFFETRSPGRGRCLLATVSPAMHRFKSSLQDHSGGSPKASGCCSRGSSSSRIGLEFPMATSGLLSQLAGSPAPTFGLERCSVFQNSISATGH